MSVSAIEALRRALESGSLQDRETAEAVGVALAAAEAFTGECRVVSPYSRMYPVLTRDGLRWCCTHDEEHCSESVAGLASQ